MKNTDAVCLACHEVGGAFNRIDIEDIALTVYELAPSQFCWNHHPDRVDLRKVQYALKNEALSADSRLAGSVKEGYQLTPHGLEWLQSTTKNRGEDGPSGSLDIVPKIDSERRRLRSTTAFKKHANGKADTITRLDFNAFVRINDYFPETLRTQRMARIKNIVAGDAELEAVWSSLKSIFGGETDD